MASNTAYCTTVHTRDCVPLQSLAFEYCNDVCAQRTGIMRLYRIENILGWHGYWASPWDWQTHHSHHPGHRRNSLSVSTPVHNPAAGECGLLPQHNRHRMKSRCSGGLTLCFSRPRRCAGGHKNNSGNQLMFLPGSRIAQVSEDARETSFLFQCCSVLVQRFNAVLLHDSLPVIDCTDWWSDPLLYILIFELPREHTYRGYNNIIIIMSYIYIYIYPYACCLIFSFLYLHFIRSKKSHSKIQINKQQKSKINQQT